jgi:hypothetical protein
VLGLVGLVLLIAWTIRSCTEVEEQAVDTAERAHWETYTLKDGSKVSIRRPSKDKP